MAARRRRDDGRRQRRHPSRTPGDQRASPRPGRYAACGKRAPRSSWAPARTSAPYGRSPTRCATSGRPGRDGSRLPRRSPSSRRADARCPSPTCSGRSSTADPGEYFSADQFHPSSLGYRRCGEVLLPSAAAALGFVVGATGRARPGADDRGGPADCRDARPAPPAQRRRPGAASVGSGRRGRGRARHRGRRHSGRRSGPLPRGPLGGDPPPAAPARAPPTRCRPTRRTLPDAQEQLRARRGRVTGLEGAAEVRQCLDAAGHAFVRRGQCVRRCREVLPGHRDLVADGERTQVGDRPPRAAPRGRARCPRAAGRGPGRPPPGRRTAGTAGSAARPTSSGAGPRRGVPRPAAARRPRRASSQPRGR